MQPALFCPSHYNAQFCTLEFTNDDFGWKCVYWAYGKPTGHAWYASIFDAVLAIVSNGWQWASEGMRVIFTQDVLMGGL